MSFEWPLEDIGTECRPRCKSMKAIVQSIFNWLFEDSWPTNNRIHSFSISGAPVHCSQKWWPCRRFRGNSCRDLTSSGNGSDIKQTQHWWRVNTVADACDDFWKSWLEVCRHVLVRRCSANELPWGSNTLRPRQLPVPPNACRPFEVLRNSSGASLLCGIDGCHCEASAPPILIFRKPILL